MLSFERARHKLNFHARGKPLYHMVLSAQEHLQFSRDRRKYSARQKCVNPRWLRTTRWEIMQKSRRRCNRSKVWHALGCTSTHTGYLSLRWPSQLSFRWPFTTTKPVGIKKKRMIITLHSNSCFIKLLNITRYIYSSYK